MATKKGRRKIKRGQRRVTWVRPRGKLRWACRECIEAGRPRNVRRDKCLTCGAQCERVRV